MNQLLRSIVLWFISCFALLSTSTTYASYSNFYVKASATGTGSGTSWTDAFTDLQVAIDIAGPGDLICVAAGTYFPVLRHPGIDDRSATFFINKDLIILGGFPGIPGTEGSMDDRDPEEHQTILSGDLGIAGDNVDNAYHVLWLDHVSDTARIDGFIIEKGGGVGTSGIEGTGSGIFNNAEAGRSHPVIANCVIRDHLSSESGGGVYNYAANGGKANPRFISCVFIRNVSSGGAGFATYVDSEGTASPVFINCMFMGNTARTAGGGAMTIIAHSAVSSPRLINCVFSGNHSPNSAAISGFVTGTSVSRIEIINSAFSGNSGGSVRHVNLGTGNCSIVGRNSIFWHNTGGHGTSSTNAEIDIAFSVIPFTAGEGNIGLDPLFVIQPPLDSMHTLGDLRLQADSPAIDFGRNSDVPAGITTDLDGKARFVNAVNGQAGIVDMGPFEYAGPSAVHVPRIAFDWKLFPNPAHNEINITIPSDFGEGHALLFDAQGSIIARQQIFHGQSTISLSVSHCQPGMYFLVIRNALGEDVRKVVIE